jgi:hypothetical protein
MDEAARVHCWTKRRGGVAAGWWVRNQRRCSQSQSQKIVIKSEIKGMTLAIKKERLP